MTRRARAGAVRRPSTVREVLTEVRTLSRCLARELSASREEIRLLRLASEAQARELAELSARVEVATSTEREIAIADESRGIS